MPFCLNIKQKLRQQQLQQRLQEAAMMRRRMAQMNARMNPGGMAASSQPSGKGVPGGMPHHPTMVQGGMPNHANAAPGKPGSSAHPNQNVLEAVKKVFYFYIYLAHQGSRIQFSSHPTQSLTQIALSH